MPWCEQCAKYLAPSAMTAEGACPTCGRKAQSSTLTDAADDATTEPIDESTPWHFKLLVAALIVYLGWRVVDIFV